MALDLTILRKEIRNYVSDATDETIDASCSAAEAAFVKEAWDHVGSIAQHALVLVHYLNSSLTAEIINAVSENNHDNMLDAIDGLNSEVFNEELKIYLKSRLNLYITADKIRQAPPSAPPEESERTSVNIE